MIIALKYYAALDLSEILQFYRDSTSKNHDW